MKRLINLLSVICLLVLPLLVSAADPLAVKFPAIPSPAGAQVSLIAEHMAINGLPMRIKELRFQGREQQLVDFYRQHWLRIGSQFISDEKSHGQRILGGQIGRFFHSLQFQSDGPQRWLGQVSISAVPGSWPTDLKSRFPLPPGFRIVRKIEALDFGQRSESLTSTGSMAPDAALSAMRTQLERDGWRELSDQSPAYRSAQIEFERAGQFAQITLMKDPAGAGSRLMVHWVKK